MDDSDTEELLDELNEVVDDDNVNAFSKPNKYIPLLPNADVVEKCADVWFQEILNSLTSAVLVLDIKDGARHWCLQLQRYIGLYGYRFTKAQHIQLVKTMYELTISPDLEISVVEPFAKVLVKLLKFKSTLSPEDLVLPWKPLYKMYMSIYDNKYDSYGQQFLVSYATSLVTIVTQNCRTFFCSKTASQELLDETKSFMCPFDSAMIDALDRLVLFLPTSSLPQYHDTMFKLWFDKFMDIFIQWDTMGIGMEQKIFKLIARLAGHNIGHVDWELHIPMLYEKMLSSCSFPVGPSKYQKRVQRCQYNMDDLALLMIAMITPTNSAFDHLKRLIRSLEPFVHPSNYGSWQSEIQGLISKLTTMFAERIYVERYKKVSWDNYIPSDAKLTDTQITEYVELIKPLMYVGLFSKTGPRDMCTTMFYLAFMRPEKVIPEQLDNLYQAIENQMNPHRLIATLSAMCAITRAMMHNTKWYPEGRLHVFPILQMCLPGIDSNDLSKTLSTLQLITSFCTLIPLVDCSDAPNQRSDLDDIERELCSHTSQIQDFVFMYIDRIFALIDGLSLDHTESAAAHAKSSTQEVVVEMSLRSATTTLFLQVSTSLYKVAFEKVWRTLSSGIFETLVGGPLAGALLFGLIRANPALSLPHILPSTCDKILALTSNPEVLADTRVDNTLLWNLLIACEAVRGVGHHTVPYEQQIFAVIKRTISMTNKKCQTAGANMMSRFFQVLLSIYPTNHRSYQVDLDTPLSEYLPIRDWGKHIARKDIVVDWHIPSEREVSVAEKIFTELVTNELEFFKSNQPMDREDLERRLKIITECLSCGAHLPFDKKPALLIDRESIVDTSPPDLPAQFERREFTLNGGNARNEISKALLQLTDRLLKDDKDSAGPLSMLAKLLYRLLRYAGTSGDVVKSRGSSIKSMKKALEHPFIVGRGLVRMVQVEICTIYQEKFSHWSAPRDVISDENLDIIQTLFKIATSRYDEARSAGRSTLLSVCKEDRYLTRKIAPWIADILINYPDQSEEKFQGALSLLVKPIRPIHQPPMVISTDPVVCQTIWPALVQASHSEKPKIQALVDQVVKKIETDHETAFFSHELSEASLAECRIVRESLGMSPVAPDAVAHGAMLEQSRREKYRQSYDELISQLVSLLNSQKLQWKHQEYAMKMLAFSQRFDRKISMDEMRLIVGGLINTTPGIRKICLKTVTGTMYSLKDNWPHEYVKSSEFMSYQDLQYDRENLPDTAEKWNGVFVEKTHWGCTTWPDGDGVPVTRLRPSPTKDSLCEQSVLLLEAFQKPEFTKSLFSFLSADTKQNQFNTTSFMFFKTVVRALGPLFVDCCKPEIEALQAEVNHQTEASRQRCISEFTSAVVRSSKYWSFTEMTALYDWLIPLMKKCLTNLNSDARAPWATALATCTADRDPRKLYRLLEFLVSEVEDGLNTEGSTSLQTSSQLYLLQGVLSQQQWRMPGIKQMLAKLLHQHIASPFKILRTRIALVLSSLCSYDDIKFMPDAWGNPKRGDVLSCVLSPITKLLENEQTEPNSVVMEIDSPVPSPSSSSNALSATVPFDSIPLGDRDMKLLSQLVDSAMMSRNSTAASLSDSVTISMGGESDIEVDPVPEEELKNGMKEENRDKLLYKTVMCWTKDNFEKHYTYQKWTPEFLRLMPLIAPHVADFADPEMRLLSESALKYMSHAVLPAHLVDGFLHAAKTTAGMKSWRARRTLLEILQVMVFKNQFTLGSHSTEIAELIVHLLSDDQYEVQQTAAATLSGAIQFGFIDAQKSGLADKFVTGVQTTNRARRKKKLVQSSDGFQLLHTNIAGIAAVVKAYPYDVPEFLPELLMILSDHVDDPQPIQKTVKDALSEFKRTHHDNWVDHKQKFTDDQLVVLTNLLVSPNYYA